MRKLLFLLILLYSTIAFSQKINETQLAVQYFNDQKYEQAADIFEKLFDKTHSNFYLEYYIKSLIKLNDLKTAEKVLKKQIRKKPNELSYIVNLGYLYQVRDDYATAQKFYDKAISKIPPDRAIINRLANSFMSKQEYGYAEKVYLQARKRMKGLKFHYELANIYSAQKNYAKMINEFLDILLENPYDINNIKNRLQYYVVNLKDKDLKNTLRSKLIKRTQIYPNKAVYNQMLLWYYLQENNFDAAFIQAKALDKRLGENSKRILKLAATALKNKDYADAKKAYKYAINNAERSAYAKARLGLLNTYYQEIAEGEIKSASEIKKIEQEYLSTIEEFGLNQTTIKIIKNLAHLEAFYLDKTTEAIDLLNSALAIQNLPFSSKALCKIELGDIQVLTGDIWEAVLTYGQVEKENSENPLGHLARFKKAQLAYYTGKFIWSKAQLDVLKSSTSKLIANDAADLSLLISDNLNEDSVSMPLKIFARADLLSVQKKDSLALLTLDSLQTKYPQHNIIDDVYYKKAQIFKKEHKDSLAFRWYKKLVEEYPYSILADNSLFYMGNYAQKIGNKTLAMKYFKELMLKHPDSLFTQEARKQFRKLRGDFTTQNLP